MEPTFSAKIPPGTRQESCTQFKNNRCNLLSRFQEKMIKVVLMVVSEEQNVYLC